MKSTGRTQTARGILGSRFCTSTTSNFSLPLLTLSHCARSSNAFVSTAALRSPTYSTVGSSNAFAQFRVRSNAQMVRAVRPMSQARQAWQAPVGRSAARDAAPQVQRFVLSGRGEVQGKIKGRGTALREKPVCTWGWRGTRLGAAACREGAKSRIGIGGNACFARRTATVLDGAIR